MDPGVIGLEPKQTKRGAEVHGVPIAHYLCRSAFGTEKIREQCKAENEGIKISIPSAVRWPGRVAVKA